MKNKIPILVYCLMISSLFACSEREDNPGPWEGSGPLTDYTVTPINGGATITYATPGDPDLLYIMAEYTRNGETFSEKSSVYNNSLTIEGFNTTNPVKASLYKVNKKGQRSAPLQIEFTPLESVISIAMRTMNIETTFGGIIVSWENPLSTELGIRLMVKDSLEKMETSEMYYSEMTKEKHSFRGFENKEITFGISVEDKWGNISDTLTYSTTPFIEVLIPKPYSDARRFIPYDNTTNLPPNPPYSYYFSSLWDNITNTFQNGFLTNPGGSGRSFTIDLQCVAKLSRLHVWGYSDYIYGQVGITGFDLYGTDRLDEEKLQDKSYWLDETIVRDGGISGVSRDTAIPKPSFEDDWEFLGSFYFPDELQNVSYGSPEFTAYTVAGLEFDIDQKAKPVRYVRFMVRRIDFHDNIPSNNYFSLGEVSFYGDNTVSQD